MGQQQAKPARVEPPRLTSYATSTEAASPIPVFHQAPVSAPIVASTSQGWPRIDFAPTSAPTGFSITRSFSRRGKTRHAGSPSVASTTPASEYKNDMLRQLGTAATLTGNVPKLPVVDDLAGVDLPPTSGAATEPIQARRPITPTRRSYRVSTSNGSRSGSIKSSKRAEREWRARLAALSSGVAIPREPNPIGGPVPPRRQVGRPRAATHAKLASTPTPHSSLDFKRELVKATSFDTLGAKGLLSADEKRGSRPMSASTSKTFASLMSQGSITASSMRVSHIPTTPHHLTFPPLTPDATPVQSPRSHKASRPLARSPSFAEPSLASSHSPMPSPASVKFDISLHTPPQLRPLSELSGVEFTFPRNSRTPSDPHCLYDEDGESVLASRKREKMVGSRRSFPRLKSSSSGDEHAASDDAEAASGEDSPTLQVAVRLRAKSSYTLDFISPNHSISSCKSPESSPESPTTAFILTATSIDPYAWGMDLDGLKQALRRSTSLQTPTKAQQARRAHPFAASTSVMLCDELCGFDTSPSSTYEVPVEFSSPVGSSPPSAVAYGRQGSLRVERAEPSSPSPKPRGRNELRRGGFDLTTERVQRAVMQPVDQNRRPRRVVEAEDKIPTRKAFELTPGADGGHRPPKSGLPRPDIERWLQRTCA